MSQVEQQAIQQLQGLKSDYQMIYEKLAEMEMELQEHQVVIDALIPVEPTRKCHRLVGGVLVERTVGEVLPALEKNKAGIIQAMDNLHHLLKEKETEIMKIQKELGALAS